MDPAAAGRVLVAVANPQLDWSERGPAQNLLSEMSLTCSEIALLSLLVQKSDGLCKVSEEKLHSRSHRR